MVVGEGCSTSPDKHTLFPDPHLSTMHSQGHCQDQIWMEGIGTRETHCYCHHHCLHCPDHSECLHTPDVVGKLLLHKGIDVNVQDVIGYTALM
jgi:hypothetical protein